jgi:hypothetical protein
MSIETKEITEDTKKYIENLIRVIRMIKKGSVYEIALKYCDMFDVKAKDKNGKNTQEWHDTYRKISYTLKRANSLGILADHHISTSTEQSSAPIDKRIYEFKGD